MSVAPPRPPPSAAVGPPAQRALEPEETIHLPTGEQVGLLLALCRRGGVHQPYAVVDGWEWHRWEDAAGHVGHVGLRTPEHPDHNEADELATRALAAATTRQRSYVELAALLSRLVEFDGAERQWRLERVAELLYGPAQPNSHRERQLPPLHGWLALMERGRWSLDTTLAANRNRAQRRSSHKASALDLPGNARPLVSIERATRCSATARLDPGFAISLGASVVEVPDHTFRLPQPGHTNPHGNRPSLATRARVRLGAAIAYRRHRGEQPIDLERLLVDYAGVDLRPVARRRRLATWFDVLTGDLATTRGRLGVGLDAVPRRARHVLHTTLRLVSPEHLAGPRLATAAATQPLAARGP
ncbi:MAG TPA: hypothetical protein VGV93_01865 [Acidimicrobiales bacterium]|nr:hypothetical protein [Acidimicrobiales bacterium]